MTNTEYFIERYKIDYVKEFFGDTALYNYCVMTMSDYKKIDKLMTIKTLDKFWDNVRKFTKKVYNDHAISRWQCLAEMREIQLDLQQNYYINNNKILQREI